MQIQDFGPIERVGYNVEPNANSNSNSNLVITYIIAGFIAGSLATYLIIQHQQKQADLLRKYQVY